MALPAINSLQDLANFLSVKRGLLAYYAFYVSPGDAYSNFSIKKRSGSDRSIDAPVKGLRDIQTIIYKKFSGEIEFRKCAFGYIPGRGIFQNSERHIRQRWVLRIDLKDFFPSITAVRVAGIFSAQPFNISYKAARTLALIATKNGVLPQGSPLSPWISNVVCRGLDYTLQKLASRHKCYYTRYADDLYFSTSNSVFPSALAHRSEKESIIVIGDELKAAIIAAGFTPNEEKTSLRPASQRQIVTGVVVNSKPNVPKEFVKGIRAALYAWEKHGLLSAEENWQKNVDVRNRWDSANPRFRWVLRGKINHLRHIKGEADPVYIKLASRLKSLDNTYSFDPKLSALSITQEVSVFSEGITDKKHLEIAFKHAQSKGLYPDLNLKFYVPNEAGSSNLQKLCYGLSSTPQRCLTICLFDRDESQYIKSMGGSSSDYLDHNNNVYSLILPHPAFRTEPDICIEHLYEDKYLYMPDSKGRRFYSKNEFDKHNCYIKEQNIFIKATSKSLIIDSNVIDISKKTSIALAKNEFASLIYTSTPPFDKISFDGFLPLFDKIREIKNLFK
ncbi:TPA: reverse transcriptase domain-containing protein [Pseudomonas aeruginosa]|uniref:reverse transcriptase domain-containing protein n=1 Tax=Pseudomonas aeruginosa TaxID=287 RepID=UPI000940F5F4|nr:reverse transcriptase domain-containing protein [Pseudomonas aeruginosa]ELK4906921.1 RNA-directed DNA polymerase [Pseudomonas aeruginosa]MBG6610438.1 RNA-directed DNA polymerase [Pseudomonas aeruginosa]RTX24848.1 RNA-directed DNA polymerase [Pseudomonas aeruginosa]HEJ1305900.1 RNA-directed DNA polymerase [Pseudomonas aeruginosa]HEJ2207436.1 RNA-directed DNA polymerase [Pseudomonas aeruginosa]